MLFSNRVQNIINNIDIISFTAFHDVGTHSSIKGVISCTAIESVVPSTGCNSVVICLTVNHIIKIARREDIITSEAVNFH